MKPKLLKDGGVADDAWVRLADDAPLPAGRVPVIVTLARWQAEREALLARGAPLGVVLRSDQPPALIADDLAHFACVALDFPKFTDGRAYSAARLLRERYGFAGELRAVGHVLRDQLLFMHRCGFDAFEIARADAAEAWETALAEISVFYQPAADGRATAMALRHRRPRPAAPNARPPRPETAPTGGPAVPATPQTAAACCAGDWAY